MSTTELKQADKVREAIAAHLGFTPLYSEQELLVLGHMMLTHYERGRRDGERDE